jgi:hypothetical protein
MTDQELAALTNHVHHVIALIAKDSEASREAIEYYIKTTRFDRAISNGTLDTLNMMDLLTLQIQLQAATLELLQEIKHRLPVPPR